MFGVIEYDLEGKPMCELCGLSFNRVLSHVRQKHKMDEKYYKKKFGFDLHKGICSVSSAEKTRVKTLQNYDKCISKNLVKKGDKTRFKKGDKGRTKDKVSEQTKLRLKANLTKDNMIKAMQKSGQNLGKSGLGNKARWGKND